MAKAPKNKRIFRLNITEDTIYMLAEERDIPREKITPEVMQRVKDNILSQFRNWDWWIQEVVTKIVEYNL